MIQRIIDIKTDGLAAFVKQSRRLVLALEYQTITIAMVDKDLRNWVALEVIQFAKEDLENIVEYMSELKRVSALMNYTGLDTYIYVRTPDAMPIPSRLINNAMEFVTLQFGLPIGEMVHTAKADSNISVAFKVQAAWIDAFKVLFPEATISSTLSLLIKQGLASNEKTANPSMQLVFSRDVAELTLVQHNKLLIAKCFPFKVVDDLIYQILDICKQLEITPKELSIKVQGLLDEKSPLYGSLLKFFEQVQFDLADSLAWGAPFKSVPAHYFTSLIKAS